MLLLKGARQVDLWNGKSSEQIKAAYHQDLDDFLDRVFAPARSNSFVQVREAGNPVPKQERS